MEVLRVQAALLRSLVPDLVLREGMQVVASVAERAGARGIIVLAGSPLAAELPDGVAAGDVLRLQVADVSADRVVLRIVEQPAALPLPAAAPVAVPLPGGRSATIAVDERAPEGSRDDDASAEVRLAYASPSLGALQLHLALDAGGVRVGVRARAGAPFELAQAAAEELRAAVAEAV
ncbi:MAG: hypothetical protein QOJ89_3465, partial [bacterium]